jgi:hypothetical protein
MNTVHTTTGSVLLTLALGAATQAQTIEVPGYSIFNFVTAPEGVPSQYGDIVFDEGGELAYFLGASESADAGVWTAPVNRNLDGNVLSFGPAKELFLQAGLDTGLTMDPDGSGTLFCMSYDFDPAVVQRLADGTIELDTAISATANGGLAFVPNAYTLSGRLLRSTYDYYLIYSYTATPDGDGSYTLGGEEVYVDLSKDTLEIGDIEFVQTGPLANTLIVADYGNYNIIYMDVDPTTGLPAGGINPATSVFFTSYQYVWGLAIDPVTGNIWAIAFDDRPFMQIIEGESCQWDCGGDNDGDVGIVDFLELLAQWDGGGTCDFDGGGVGIVDFLKLLAEWGPCP